MASKYSALVGVLPRYLGTEPGYQEKVDAAKTEILRPAGEGEEPISTREIEIHVETINATAKALCERLTRICGGKRWASELAKAHREIRKVKDMLEDHVSAVNLVLEAHNQLLIEQYEVEGTTFLKLEDGGSIGVQPEPFAVVKDRDACRIWAIDNGLERTLALPWPSLNSIVKERLLAGEPCPDGVDAFMKSKIVFRKG